MIKRDSYIGTVFIENCENFDSMGYLTPVNDILGYLNNNECSCVVAPLCCCF